MRSIPAFSCAIDGETTPRDWETGALLAAYEGPVLSYRHGEGLLMYTCVWQGERHYGPWRENAWTSRAEIVAASAGGRARQNTRGELRLPREEREDEAHGRCHP